MFVKIKKGKRRIRIKLRKLSFFEMANGLMFRSRTSENLLFEFSKETRRPIHSIFVFFPFVAVWLDKENRVLEYRNVRPFTISVKPRKNFKKLIEIPINEKNRRTLKFFVGERKI